MKLRNLFMAAIAGAFAFASCEEIEQLGAPMLNLDPSELSFDKGEDSKSVTLSATLNWEAKVNESWVALSQISGKASSDKVTISVSVEANDGNDREADIVFSAGGGMVKSTLKIKQKGALGAYEAVEGDGSKEKPFNVAQAVEAVSRLTWTDNTTYEKIGPYYVKGKICAISDPYKSDYGNGTFTISDDGNATGPQFKAYRIYYLENKKWVEGNKQISVGDIVVIYGELMYFGSGADKPREAETVQKGSYLYSLNGETQATGGVEIDYNNSPATTVADLIAKADETNYYKLTGTVSKFNASYCSFDLTDATGSIYVYSVANKTAWDGKIKNGATVTLAGKYKLYKKADGSTQNEIVDAQILSCEGGTETDYSSAQEITVADLIAKNDEQGLYKLTGTVSNFNSTYCSFDLTDATGVIYVYSVENKAEWSSKIQNGGVVSLAGKYQLYKKEGKPDQPEIINAHIFSFEEGQPGPEDEPTGSGTLADPYNPKAAYDAAAALEKDAKSENDVYIKGKIASVKYLFSAGYGTANFNISEDGTTAGTQFPCYSILYLGNRKWEEGDAQIAVGDEVIVCGKIFNYNGTTPETASQEAYIYSLNGQTSIAQSEVFGVESDKINVAASATSAVIKVKGNVSWTVSSMSAGFSPNAGEGAGEVTVTFPANTDTENTQTYNVTIKGMLSEQVQEIVVTITQAKASSGNVKVDVIDREFTGVSGTSYTEWSGKAGSESPAVYAGQSAGGNSSVQLRSNNSNSGIISTTSGGTVRAVSVEWNSNTADGRKLDIYGSNTAYTSPTDLYDNAKKGTLLGSIEKGKTTSIEVTGDFQYIGLRSNSGAMYLTSISISWE